MAVVNIFEMPANLDRLVIVDAAAVVDQEIYNKTGGVLELTFAKDDVRGGRTVLVPDNTVPLPVIEPGGSYTVTAQQINDAIAAGNHADIFIFSRDRMADTTTSSRHVVVGGVTQPAKTKKTKK